VRRMLDVRLAEVPWEQYPTSEMQRHHRSCTSHHEHASTWLPVLRKLVKIVAVPWQGSGTTASSEQIAS